MLDFIVALTTVVIWITGCSVIALLALIGAQECWTLSRQIKSDRSVDKEFKQIVNQP